VANGNGVFVCGTATIGGTTAGAGNVISGNLGAGINAGDNSVVQGNLIGTDATGETTVGTDGKSLGNATGIVTGGPVLIGGTDAADRNVISGNGTGISVDAAGAVIQGNYTRHRHHGQPGAGQPHGNRLLRRGRRRHDRRHGGRRAERDLRKLLHRN
jgi:hypothetical protein